MLARMQGVAARLVKGPARKAELTRAESCGELMGLARRGGLAGRLALTRADRGAFRGQKN